MKNNVLTAAIALALAVPLPMRADETAKVPKPPQDTCISAAQLIGAACYATSTPKTSAQNDDAKDFCLRAAAVAYKGCEEGHLAKYFAKFPKNPCVAIAAYGSAAVKITCGIKHPSAVSPEKATCDKFGDAVGEALYSACADQEREANTI